MKSPSPFGHDRPIDRISGKEVNWFEPGDSLLPCVDVAEVAPEKPHLWWGYLLLLVILGVFAFRLNNLQIANGQNNQQLAEGNGIRQIATEASRGLIVDRNGKSLATNISSFNLVVVPANLPQDKTARLKSYDTISKEFKIDKAKLVASIDQAGLASLEPVTLQTDLARNDALVAKLQVKNLPGFQVVTSLKRQYDTTTGIANILGYVGPMTDKDLASHPNYLPTSQIGHSGSEAAYDQGLRGADGINDVEVDAQGQIQRTSVVASPKAGDTLKLTIDKDFEQFMANSLQKSMDEHKVTQGVGIAMDPHTGAILADVSLPSFDNNVFSGGISAANYDALTKNPDQPLLDRAVNGQYPPGSTIKPVVASGALQEKIITPSTTLDTSAGAIRIGQWSFPDWTVHGVTNVAKAIAQSNDIFFYSLGGGWSNISGLGVDRLKKYNNIFGLGSPTGIDYSSEESGLIPDGAWKKQIKKEDWYIGDTYHMAIGQGDVLTTPMQMARAISAVANGGTLVTPHVAGSFVSADGSSITPLAFPTKTVAVDPANLAVVRQGMTDTVESSYGTAPELKSLPFTSAGKTGTAQFGANNEASHAWYIGYAPADNPQIVVVILVAGGGGEGSPAAAPVAGQVMNWYMSHK